jgi:hypothetical protein
LETLVCRTVPVTRGATKVRSLAVSWYASSALTASDCKLVLEHKLVCEHTNFHLGISPNKADEPDSSYLVPVR